ERLGGRVADDAGQGVEEVCSRDSGGGAGEDVDGGLGGSGKGAGEETEKTAGYGKSSTGHGKHLLDRLGGLDSRFRGHPSRALGPIGAAPSGGEDLVPLQAAGAPC